MHVPSYPWPSAWRAYPVPGSAAMMCLLAAWKARLRPTAHSRPSPPPRPRPPHCLLYQRSGPRPVPLPRLSHLTRDMGRSDAIFLMIYELIVLIIQTV